MRVGREKRIIRQRYIAPLRWLTTKSRLVFAQLLEWLEALRRVPSTTYESSATTSALERAQASRMATERAWEPGAEEDNSPLNTAEKAPIAPVRFAAHHIECCAVRP